MVGYLDKDSLSFKSTCASIKYGKLKRKTKNSLILESLNASAVLMTSTNAWNSNRRSSAR